MRLNIREVRKPKFRLRIGEKKDSDLGLPWSLWSEPFRVLVMHALAASQRVAKLQAPGASKLSCDAFLRETLKIQKSATVARVKALKRRLESGDLRFDYTHAALRKMVKELRGPNLRTPPTAARWEERSRSMFLQPRVTEVLSELAAVDATALELFGVAVMTVGEQTPSVFGNADGEQANIDADIAAAVAERDALFAKIGTSWTAADVDPGTYSQGHTSAAKFKGTPVEVPPTESAGYRLIQALESGAKLVEALRRQRA